MNAKPAMTAQLFKLAVVVLLLGAVMTVLGVFLGSAAEQASADLKTFTALKSGGGKATGTVVDVVEQERSSKHRRGQKQTWTVYCPVFSYQTDSGIDQSLQPNSNCSTEADAMKKGDTATIYYDPQSPSKAFADTKATAASLEAKSTGPNKILWIGIGVLVVGAAGIVLILVRMRKQRAAVSA